MTINDLKRFIWDSIEHDLVSYLESDRSAPVVSCATCGRDMNVTRHTVDDLICSPVVEPCECGGHDEQAKD